MSRSLSTSASAPTGTKHTNSLRLPAFRDRHAVRIAPDAATCKSGARVSGRLRMQIIPVCMHYQSASNDAVIASAEAALRNFERRINVSSGIRSHISQIAGVMLGCARPAMRRGVRIKMLSCAGGIMRRAVAKLVYVYAVVTVRLEPGQVRI